MDDRERELLALLAHENGIVEGYYDVWRNFHVTAPQTQRRLLQAMGLAASSPEVLEQELEASRSDNRRPPPSLPDAPARAFSPRCLDEGRKIWGINAPLYGIRSSRNWGVGDFGDLRWTVEWAAGLGADFVGLLPLHALFNEAPYGLSPYYPSSRLFLNPVYLAVDQVPEARFPEVRVFLENEETRETLDRLRASPLVDYPAAWGLKRTALRLCYDVFVKGSKTAGRRVEFDAWCKAQGPPLENFATFTALRESFTARDGHGSHWSSWPEEFRRPEGEGVSEFRRAHGPDIEFHVYLQWLASVQLASAAGLARDLGLGVGLYLDMALGADPAGADAWMFQDLLALSVSAGCPPDPFSLMGQRWGLPPAVPRRHRASGYALLRETLHRNAAYAGALRIDHALALWRLFWIPEGVSAAGGAYVKEHPEELLTLLRQVSHEHECLIVGEDLGTIPTEVREGLMSSGLFSYRLAIFEREADGRCRRPASYPRQALVSASTHDLPTLDGFWQGRDLAVKESLSQYPDVEAATADREGRKRDRADLLEAIRTEGLLPRNFDPQRELSEGDLEELAVATHAFLARSASALFLVNLDDLMGEMEMQNLPGTIDEHPNWRRKCSVPVEGWVGFPRANRIAAAITAEGRGRVKNGS